MAKLVILNQGMTGRACELAADRTTVGRVEDNTFQIADPSVSSHHCEVQKRGGEIFVRDLNSTNGTYIGDARITESVLKPGQTMRLGQVEVKLEVEGAPAPPTLPNAPAPPKKPAEATMVMPRGVSLDQLEQGGRKTGFDTTSNIFKKKKNKAQYFWIIAGIGIFIILVLIIFVAHFAK